MKVAYFTVDMNFAVRLCTLLGSIDEEIVFSIFESKSLGDNFKTESEREKALKNFDLILKDEEISELQLAEADLTIGVEEKLFTLPEHYHRLVSAYREKKGIRDLELYKGNAKLIMICGAEGGSGKTTVSLALAEELARFHDKKVLYLCLEPFSGGADYFESDEKKKSLDKYLYYTYSNAPVNLYDFLIESQYGVFAFVEAKGKNPIYELDGEELVEFLRTLNREGEFDYIVCDSYALLGEAEKNILSSAHKICVVEKESEETYLNTEKTRHRNENFLHYIKTDLYISSDKLLRAKNFSRIQNGEKKGIVNLAFDINSIGLDESGKRRISIDKDFGLGIKSLCEALM